jgi:hypothetical protein
MARCSNNHSVVKSLVLTWRDREWASRHNVPTAPDVELGPEKFYSSIQTGKFRKYWRKVDRSQFQRGESVVFSIDQECRYGIVDLFIRSSRSVFFRKTFISVGIAGNGLTMLSELTNSSSSVPVDAINRKVILALLNNDTFSCELRGPLPWD